ncbi:hypothetical protein HDV05_006042 [Chytridiales sp. JEL 0842]|nr:hypothetical protein HDV05_006042 [Chytridiales sp. JEL 0842]
MLNAVTTGFKQPSPPGAGPNSTSTSAFGTPMASNSRQPSTFDMGNGFVEFGQPDLDPRSSGLIDADLMQPSSFASSTMPSSVVLGTSIPSTSAPSSSISGGVGTPLTPSLNTRTSSLIDDQLISPPLNNSNASSSLLGSVVSNSTATNPASPSRPPAEAQPLFTLEDSEEEASPIMKPSWNTAEPQSSTPYSASNVVATGNLISTSPVEAETPNNSFPNSVSLLDAPVLNTSTTTPKHPDSISLISPLQSSNNLQTSITGSNGVSSIAFQGVVEGENVVLDNASVSEKLHKLKKYESKYPELAKAYESLAQKVDRMESVIKLGTPLTNGIRNSADLEALIHFFRETKSKADTSSDEIEKLKRQVGELKEIQQLEAATKMELFTSTQAKIAERDEEIKSLKAKLLTASQPSSLTNLVDVNPTPTKDLPATPSTPPRRSSSSFDLNASQTTATSATGESSVEKDEVIQTMKSKLRELAGALKRVTEQRNKAIERCKDLSGQLSSATPPSTTASAPLITPTTVQESGRNGDGLVDIDLGSNKVSSAGPVPPPAGHSSVPTTTQSTLPSYSSSQTQEIEETKSKLAVAQTKIATLSKDLLTLRKLLSEKENTIRHLKDQRRSTPTRGGTPTRGLSTHSISSDSKISGEWANAGAATLESEPAIVDPIPLELELENGTEASEEEVALLERLETLSKTQEELISLQERLKESEESRKELEGRLSKLLSDAEKGGVILKAEKAEGLEKELEGVKKQLEELEKSKASVEAELQASNDKLKQADQTVSETLDNLAKAETGRQEAQSKLDALEKTIATHESTVAESLQAKTEALGKMEKAYSVIRKIKTDMDAKSQQLELLKTEHEVYVRTGKDLERQLEEQKQKFENQVRDLEGDLKGRVDELGALKSAMEVLQAQVDRVGTERDVLKSDLEKVEGDMEKLKGELEEERAKKGGEASGEEVERLKGEKEVLAAKVQDLESALESEKHRAGESAQKLVALESLVDSMKSEVDAARQKAQEFEGLLGSERSQASETQNQLQLATAKLKELESQAESLQSQLAETSRALESEKESLASAVREKDSLQASLDDSQAKHAEVLNALKAQHESDQSSLREKIRETQASLETAMSEKASLTARIGELQKKFDDEQASTLSKVKELESLEKRLAESLRLRETLETELDGVRNEMATLKDHIRTLTDEKESLVSSANKEAASAAALAVELEILKKQQESQRVLIAPAQDESDLTPPPPDFQSSELEALRGNLQELTSRFEAQEKQKNAEIADLRASFDKLESAKSELSTSLKRAEESGKEKEAMIDSLKSQETLRKGEMETVRREYESLRERYGALEVQYGEVKSCVEEMEKEREGALLIEKRLSDLEMERGGHEKVVEDLKSQLAASDNLLKGAEAKLQEATLAAEEARLAQASATESSKAGLDELRQQLDDALSLKQKLEDELTSFKQQLETASKTTSDDSHAQLAEAKVLQKKLEDEVSDLKRQLSESSAKVAQLLERQKQLDEALSLKSLLEKELKASQEQLESSTLKIKQLESSIEQATDSSSNQQDAMASKVNELIGELELAKSTITNLEASVADLTSKHKTAQDSLSTTQQLLQARESKVAEHESMLKTLRQQLAEEEEKKNKSIQLLRNSKARILKLEETVKAKDAELGSVSNELSEVRANALVGVKEREGQMAALTRQVEDMTVRLRKQKEEMVDLEKRAGDREVELEKLNVTVQDLMLANGKMKTEIETLKEAEESKREQYEQSKALLEMQASQLSVWPDRVAELERKNANLDAELETSKRLFESKSIDHESLKMRVSELERSIYETEQMAGAQAGDLDSYKRDIAQLRKEISEKTKDLRKRDVEIKDAKQEKAQAVEALERKAVEIEKEKAHVAELMMKVNALKGKEEEWVEKQQQALLEQKALAAKVELTRKELEAKLDEKDKAMEDSRARENHLQKLNKALKEEVRKLSRAAGMPTPTTTPPISQRPSGIDPAEVALANAQTAVRQPASSSSSTTNTVVLPPPVPQNTRRSFSGSLSNVAPDPAAVAASPGSPSNSSMSGGMLMSPDTNVEYLKNLMIKFVESGRDKKAQMIPALSMLLKMTPDEIKRVNRSL